MIEKNRWTIAQQAICWQALFRIAYGDVGSNYMYAGRITEKLGSLIDRYQGRFRNDPADRFSLFYTMLEHDALVARLERALKEGEPYNPCDEEWSEESKKAFDSGEMII